MSLCSGDKGFVRPIGTVFSGQPARLLPSNIRIPEWKSNPLLQRATRPLNAGQSQPAGSGKKKRQALVGSGAC